MHFNDIEITVWFILFNRWTINKRKRTHKINVQWRCNELFSSVFCFVISKMQFFKNIKFLFKYSRLT